MVSTFLLIVGIALTIIGVFFVVASFQDSPKAVPTVQYDSPIGPTQTEPFRLPSKVKHGE